VEKIESGRLKQFLLFSGLADEQLGVIASSVRLKRYDEKEEIVREGEAGGELFLLLEGEIEITKRLTLYSRDGADEKEKSLIRLKDKDNVFFGEMTLFDRAERSATITALSKVTVGILTKERIQALATEDPVIGSHMYYNIGRTLSGNLRKANRDILKLTTAFCMALDRT